MSILDNLKNSAKRWLRAIRADDASARERLRRAFPNAPAEPGLRDVQHALARERGHQNWALLRRAVEGAGLDDERLTDVAWPYWRVTDLSEFEEIASDIVRVYDTGDLDAIRRLEARYRMTVTAPALRDEIHRRLVTFLDEEKAGGAFGLSQARLILARDAGYETWDALAHAVRDGDPRIHVGVTARSQDPTPPSTHLADPIQPAELKPTLPMEMQDGEWSTTTEVWKMLVASRAGDLEHVKRLIIATPGLVTCYYNYMPPLHLAVREGHVELVRVLLDRGALDADDVTYPYNETYVTLAEDRGYGEIANLLREHGQRPEARRQKKKTAQGPGYIRFDRTEAQERLRQLIDMNAIRDVEALVSQQPDLLDDELAMDGEGILSAVARRPNRPMLELLLRCGARVPDVTKWGRAYYFKHYFIASLLLEHGMNPNHMTWHRTTLLHEMVWEGDVRKARLLLDHGADIDAVDEEFRSTPLGFAARWNRPEMIRLLLDRGADPNRSGAPWATPLAWAGRKGHTRAVRDLRAAGANQ